MLAPTLLNFKEIYCAIIKIVILNQIIREQTLAQNLIGQFHQ